MKSHNKSEKNEDKSQHFSNGTTRDQNPQTKSTRISILAPVGWTSLKLASK